MGEVYRARDSRLGRDVALKVLPAMLASDADYMARFQREAEVLASLNHPNIAAIYGLEESGGVRALVMELVEGPTLAERISAGAIPLEESLVIARQIAEALEAAHDKGIVHRDLKPANVKVTPDDKVKVLDFGLAKALDGNATASGRELTSSPTMTINMTRAGMILGTAAYMGPEQAKGKAVDRRADIWAFGVVLIEMLSGRHAPVPLALVPADTPAAIRRLLGRCLDKDPKRRLRDIGEARIAIEDVLSGGGADPDAAVVQAEVVRRPRLPWIAAALLAVVAIVAGVGWWRSSRPVLRPLMRFDVDLGMGHQPRKDPSASGRTLAGRNQSRISG
jgi:serine/threonine protein kinase